MVMRVQLELKTRGFYSGPVDGKLSQDVRDSLRGFQIVHKLTDTATMDNSTLAKLGIV